MVTYHNSAVEVLVGDHVEMKVWIEFWKGWQKGRVHYVPGISPKNDELEHGGLMRVAIHDERGCQVGVLVYPESGELRHTVRFVRRSDDDLTETPDDYYFGD